MKKKTLFFLKKKSTNTQVTNVLDKSSGDSSDDDLNWLTPKKNNTNTTTIANSNSNDEDDSIDSDVSMDQQTEEQLIAEEMHDFICPDDSLDNSEDDYSHHSHTTEDIETTEISSEESLSEEEAGKELVDDKKQNDNTPKKTVQFQVPSKPKKIESDDINPNNIVTGKRIRGRPARFTEIDDTFSTFMLQDVPSEEIKYVVDDNDPYFDEKFIDNGLESSTEESENGDYEESSEEAIYSPKSSQASQAKLCQYLEQKQTIPFTNSNHVTNSIDSSSSSSQENNDGCQKKLDYRSDSSSNSNSSESDDQDDADNDSDSSSDSEIFASKSVNYVTTTPIKKTNLFKALHKQPVETVDCKKKKLPLKALFRPKVTQSNTPNNQQSEPCPMSIDQTFIIQPKQPPDYNSQPTSHVLPIHQDNLFAGCTENYTQPIQ